MSIIAVVEQDTIKLPVHVPDGTQVEILLPVVHRGEEAPDSSPRTDDPFFRLTELAESMGCLTNEEIDTALYGG
jgi:hypothetical protein